MTQESLEATLRSVLGRRPFQPFILEMDDGRRIAVDDPMALSFGGGSVGFIGPDEIHLLRCEQIKDIRTETQPAA